MLFRIIKGINFWTVDRIIKINNEQVFKIEINQVWNGEIPNFINILILPLKFE